MVRYSSVFSKPIYFDKPEQTGFSSKGLPIKTKYDGKKVIEIIVMDVNTGVSYNIKPENIQGGCENVRI